MSKKSRERREARKGNHTTGNLTTPPQILAERNNAVLFQDETGSLFTIKKPVEFSVLKQYTVQEFEKLLCYDPSFLAEDKTCFADRYYVRNMCFLYVCATKDTLADPRKLKHFSVKDLERAVLKLEEEHPKEYAELCKSFCIDPKKQCSTNKPINISSVTPGPIIRLSNWGYAELYCPHVINTIPKIAEKMSYHFEMSDIEKAKYAQLFFLFVLGFHRMPYDEERFEILIEAEETGLKRTLDRKERKMAYDETIRTLFFEIEHEALFVANMVENAYTAYYQKLPEGTTISIDVLKYWLQNIVEPEHRLLMLEFVGLLNEEDQEEFKERQLKPLSFNNSLRILKEKLFPYGKWSSAEQGFMSHPNEKVMIALRRAYKKFIKNGFNFGAGVLTYKRAHTEKYYTLSDDKTIVYVELPGYLYARAPKTLRISDPNELEIILAH